MIPPAFHFRRLAALGAALAVVSSTACIHARTDPVTGKVAVDVASPLQKGTVWNAKVTGAPTGPVASASGQARAEVYKGQSTVTVHVEGLTPGAVHPWRVFQGRCSESGGPLGEASLYTPITVGANGVGEGSVKMPVELGITRKYKVRVYASEQDPVTVVACGDLSYE